MLKNIDAKIRKLNTQKRQKVKQIKTSLLTLTKMQFLTVQLYQ